MATYRLVQEFLRIEAVGQRGSRHGDPADPTKLRVEVWDDANKTLVEAVENRESRLWKLVTGRWAFDLDEALLEPSKAYTVKWIYETINGSPNYARQAFVWRAVPTAAHTKEDCVITGALRDIQGLPVNDARLIVEQYRDIVTLTTRTQQQTVTTDVFGNWWIELPKGALVRFVFGDVSKIIRIPRDRDTIALSAVPELQVAKMIRTDAFGYPVPGSPVTGPALEEASGPQSETSLVFELGAGSDQQIYTGPNESGKAIHAGQPVSRTTTGIVLATASGPTPRRADAIAINSSVPGGLVKYVDVDQVSTASWVPVLGQTYLSPGTTYYLGPGEGKIVSTAPDAPAVALRQIIGDAVNATTMALQLGVYEVDL